MHGECTKQLLLQIDRTFFLFFNIFTKELMKDGLNDNVRMSVREVIQLYIPIEFLKIIYGLRNDGNTITIRNAFLLNRGSIFLRFSLFSSRNTRT